MYIVHNTCIRNREIGGGWLTPKYTKLYTLFTDLPKCLGFVLQKPSCPAKMQQVISILRFFKTEISNLLIYFLIEVFYNDIDFFIYLDHHKSWQIIQIFLFSFSFELLQQYVDYARIQQEFPTADGYFQWIPHRPEKYRFLSDAAFGYCLALHVFRAGIRRNNSDAINVAKARFAPLFFGLSMPFYMETFFRDSVLRTKCPPELLNFLKKHESYSVSGNDCKGEGGDFVLESFNRNVKRLLPSGLPNEQGWIRACRNVERLAKVIKKK